MTLNLGGPGAGFALGTDNSFGLTITDGTSVVSLSEATDMTVAEGGTINLDVDITPPSAETLTVSLVFTGAPSAADVDTLGPFIIAPGLSTTTLQLTTLNDGLDETDESGTIELASVTGGTSQLGINIARNITISDDAIVVAMQSQSNQVINEGGTANILFSITPASSVPLDLTIGVDGSATNADFANLNIQIPANVDTFRRASLTVQADGLDEDKKPEPSV